MTARGAIAGLSARATRWAEAAEPGPRRSFVLLGIGALTGLALAGMGLFTAQGTTRSGVPPEDLATVNGHPVLRTDFVAQTEALYSRPMSRTAPAERRRVVADMLREELFVQRGLDLDLAASDPDVRQALVAGVERQVEADVTAQQPTDDQLRAYYVAHQADYADEGIMTVHDLVAAAPRSGDAALAQAAADLRAGAPLAQVLLRGGVMDARAAAGEEFWFAARLHLGAALFEAARPLHAGGVAGPLASGGKLHVLAMERTTPPVPLGFEAARPRVLKDLMKGEQTRMEAAELKYLRGKADIRLAPDAR